MLIPNKKWRDDIKFVQQFVGEYVQDAVRKSKAWATQQERNSQPDDANTRYVFLDELAKTGYPEKRILDELMNVLLAGRDTTASLLSHLFFILARRPDVFNKLRTEVMEVGHQRPSFEQIKSMKYLQYCLNEGQPCAILPSRSYNPRLT